MASDAGTLVVQNFNADTILDRATAAESLSGIEALEDHLIKDQEKHINFFAPPPNLVHLSKF
eukprot:5123315-Amphidinium_carterae.1